MSGGSFHSLSDNFIDNLTLNDSEYPYLSLLDLKDHSVVSYAKLPRPFEDFSEWIAVLMRGGAKTVFDGGLDSLPEAPVYLCDVFFNAGVV